MDTGRCQEPGLVPGRTVEPVTVQDAAPGDIGNERRQHTVITRPGPRNANNAGDDILGSVRPSSSRNRKISQPAPGTTLLSKTGSRGRAAGWRKRIHSRASGSGPIPTRRRSSAGSGHRGGQIFASRQFSAQMILDAMITRTLSNVPIRGPSGTCN